MTWTDNGHKINRRRYYPQGQHLIHLWVCGDESYNEPYKIEKRQHKKRSLKKKLKLNYDKKEDRKL